MKRDEVMKQVDEDLKKSFHQLLVDIRDELLCGERTMTDNMRLAPKKIMSLFARMGLD